VVIIVAAGTAVAGRYGRRLIRTARCAASAGDQYPDA
jgi:hypothetical protein